MVSRPMAVGITFAGAAAVALITATSAYAVTPTHVNITAGSLAAGTPISITGTNTTVPGSNPATTTVTLRDLRSQASIKCTSVTVNATSTTGLGSADGTANAGLNRGNINSSTWTGCSGAGLNFAVNQGSNIWKLNATNTTSSGSTDGTITDIAVASVTATSGGTCSFQVGPGPGSPSGATKGSVAGKFVNGGTNSRLDVNSAATTTTATLKLINVSSTCPALLQNNDPASFVGSFSLSGKRTSDGLAANPVNVNATT